MNSFTIEGNDFVYDGKPLQIISGALHYFRVVPDYWEDRLIKLLACGCNTVETYVPWNWHEPKPGEFRFDGMLDIRGFIVLAGDLGLHVIVRPSPYICAEWEFGGLPSWLMADPGMRVRCMHPAYVAAIDRYYDRLLPLLAPLQCTQGGPIIAMQIENEYGSYGSDAKYLSCLETSMRDRGIDVLLMTSDGPTDACLQGGTLPHIYKTVNFGSNSARAFAKLREYQPTGPLMCMEFWNGWFDHWGTEHHTREAADAAQCLDDMLAVGASVNIYMFHGGTSFGFSNGANLSERYEPTVNSYDYDAPLDEAGDVTEKFHAFRKVISKYRSLPDIDIPTPSLKANYGEIHMTEQALLFENLSCLSDPKLKTNTETMEEMGQDYGFILYSAHLSGPKPIESLVIQEVRDRALVFVDGDYVGVQYRNDNAQEVMKLAVPKGGLKLDILVENMGRLNYGPRFLERKGITDGVRHGNQFIHGWQIQSLDLADISGLAYGPTVNNTLPAFYRGTLEVDEALDTFIELRGWTKGVCFVNGLNLSRYWDCEPRRNLYLPGPLLRRGANEIVLFDLHGFADRPVVRLVDHP